MATTPTLTLLSSEVSSVEPLWLDGSRGPVPDLVPRLEVKASKRGRGEKNGKVMESMFLLSILIIAVLWLYLFPPPSS